MGRWSSNSKVGSESKTGRCNSWGECSDALVSLPFLFFMWVKWARGSEKCHLAFLDYFGADRIPFLGRGVRMEKWAPQCFWITFAPTPPPKKNILRRGPRSSEMNLLTLLDYFCANPSAFWGKGARSGEINPSVLSDYFCAPMPPNILRWWDYKLRNEPLGSFRLLPSPRKHFEMRGLEAAKWAPLWFWITLASTHSQCLWRRSPSPDVGEILVDASASCKIN